jgi:hypothetical protein
MRQMRKNECQWPYNAQAGKVESLNPWDRLYGDAANLAAVLDITVVNVRQMWAVLGERQRS